MSSLSVYAVTLDVAGNYRIYFAVSRTEAGAIALAQERESGSVRSVSRLGCEEDLPALLEATYPSTEVLR